MSELLLPASARLTHELEIKKSRFLTLVARVATPQEAREAICERRTDMPDARHHCTAFVVSTPNASPVCRSSDDGEPSGTAGRPMLDVLTGLGLVDVVAVVTRYFGGTLLGTGGLVRAYSDSVRECLEGARLVRRERVALWEAVLPHADGGRYVAELTGAGYRASPEYATAGVRIRIPTDDGDALGDLLARLSGGRVAARKVGETTLETSCGNVRAGRAVTVAARTARSARPEPNSRQGARPSRT